MVTYAPHFISTVVYCGMILIFLSSDGVINQLLKLIGIDSVAFLTNPSNFRHIYVWSGVLQNIGWGSIMYISVLTSVDPTLHEAATVDGATRFQRLLHIDLPAIVPTMVDLKRHSFCRTILIWIIRKSLQHMYIRLVFREDSSVILQQSVCLIM